MGLKDLLPYLLFCGCTVYWSVEYFEAHQISWCSTWAESTINLAKVVFPVTALYYLIFILGNILCMNFLLTTKCFEVTGKVLSVVNAIFFISTVWLYFARSETECAVFVVLSQKYIWGIGLAILAGVLWKVIEGRCNKEADKK